MQGNPLVELADPGLSTPYLGLHLASVYQQQREEIPEIHADIFRFHVGAYRHCLISLSSRIAKDKKR
jgi:hypothetical protein